MKKEATEEEKSREIEHVRRCPDMTRLLVARTTEREYVLNFLLNDELEEVRKEAAITLKELGETAIFAGGCFWGVEYFIGKLKGVKSIKSGYIGGDVLSPTYEKVCKQNTGHAEAVRIIFDSEITNYETLAKTFFEIHDPTQLDGQGPDLGQQYRSEIFYTINEQKLIAKKLIEQLKSNGLNVVTKISRAGFFWAAEEEHQNYYEKKGTRPYCHGYVKRFIE